MEKNAGLRSKDHHASTTKLKISAGVITVVYIYIYMNGWLLTSQHTFSIEATETNMSHEIDATFQEMSSIRIFSHKYCAVRHICTVTVNSLDDHVSRIGKEAHRTLYTRKVHGIHGNTEHSQDTS